MTNKKYRALEILIYILMLFVAFVLQTTNIVFEYNSPAPSLLLAIVVIVSFFENFWFSSIFGLFAGALVDSTNADSVCLYALTYMLTGFICGLLLEAYIQNNYASLAAIGFPVILINCFVDMLIKSGFTTGIFTLFFKFYFLVAIFTFAFAFILYLFFRFIIKNDERYVKPKGIIVDKK